MTRPRVTVVRKSGRRFLLLRFRDSLTGQERIRSARTNVVREAEREAARWEAELQNENPAPGEIAWADFVARYKAQHLAGLANNSKLRAVGVLESFRDSVNPSRLSSVTAGMVSRFQSLRREAGIAESTIASEIGHLRAALRWAKDVGLIREAPHFPRVRRAKTGARPMKGRPVTDVEFRAMLKATPEVVCDDRAEAWQYYIEGLWLSGLRLSESLELWWDRDDRLSVSIDDKYPLFRIPGELEKANRDRFLPMVPEFAEFLRKTPPGERHGRVFELPRYRKQGERITHWRVSETVSAIGKAAGVVVDSKGPKYASAHDLRRAFGTRWAKRVMPQVLMTLMRHASITTTMRYYVEIEAQDTAKSLWEMHAKGDSTGDTGRRNRKKPPKSA